MRAVVQRVARAAVLVSQEGRAAIGPGLLVLLGVREGDEEKDATFLAKKIAHLRVFEDEAGKFNRSLLEVQGEALVVSQFTLYGDCRKGRRPSFIQAAPPSLAERLYEGLVEALRAEGVPTKTGVFGARMDVELTNQGPVTLLLESGS
jgi:D-tyrosyl-tRNA(Tyr) deacylase